MSEDQKDPRVLVIGDAGQDQFVHNSKARPIPSGAPLIADVLRELLGRHRFTVESLVQKEPDEAAPRRRLTLLDSKDILLGPYEQTTRVTSYARSREDDEDDERIARPSYVLDPAKVSDQERERTFLVAHHAARMPWDGDIYTHCEDIVGAVAPTDKPYTPWHPIHFPRILVNLSSGLPDSNPDPRAVDKEPFRSKLWSLLERKKEGVGVVMSMSSLRAQSAVISRRLSIEQLVEDFCAELHLFPALSLLGRFSHLFVRVGMVAIVHIERSKNISTDRFSGEIYFSPYARNGLHRDPELEGGTLGRNAVLIGALLRTLVDEEIRAECEKMMTPGVPQVFDDTRSEMFRVFMRRASRRALLAMKDMDDHGYHIEDDLPLDVVRRTAHSAVAALETDENRVEDAGQQDKVAFGWRPIPAHLLVPPPPKAARSLERWHILDEVLMEAPVHRINVALAIVMAGHRRVLNRRWAALEVGDKGLEREIWNILSRVEFWDPNDRAPDFVTLQEHSEPSLPRAGNIPSRTDPIIGDLIKPFDISVPVMNFGRLHLIERDEIESLRSIANLLRLHRKQAQEAKEAKEKGKPISIAVFGPPGSGKSFAVKELTNCLGATRDKVPLMEFNVAQFSSSNQLQVALGEVAKKQDQSGSISVTPVVFFDEFDCARDSDELGWLKSFLAPMQDGKLPDGETDVGPAIFVFAGGLYPSFNRFDPRTDSAYDNLREFESGDYQTRLKRFVAQKGPDFISRLRGHIDVLPINDLPGKPKHFIRRAMQLRSLLTKNKLVKEDQMANIDQALVYAFLTTDVFRHGVRSMQAIVEMCSPIHDRIEIASLPSQSQLDMHVDADEFMIRVRRGRARLQDQYKSAVTLKMEERDFEAAQAQRRHAGNGSGSAPRRGAGAPTGPRSTDGAPS